MGFIQGIRLERILNKYLFKFEELTAQKKIRSSFIYFKSENHEKWGKIFDFI